MKEKTLNIVKEKYNKKINSYEKQIEQLRNLKSKLIDLSSDNKVRTYINVLKNYQELKSKTDKIPTDYHNEALVRIFDEHRDNEQTNNIFVYMGTYKISQWGYRGLKIDDKIYELTSYDDLNAAYRVYLDLEGYVNCDEKNIPIAMSDNFENNNKVIFPTITNPTIEDYYKKYNELKTTFIR